MLFGLPVEYLTRALVWHRRDGVWGRREGVEVPSWSWGAWKGPVSHRHEIWWFGGNARSVDPLDCQYTQKAADFWCSDPVSGQWRFDLLRVFG